MKKFGPWLAILAIALAVGGMMLASRLTVVRSAWQKKTADSKAKVLDLRKKAAEAQKLVDTARGELQEKLQGWDIVWTSPQTTKGARPGIINITLGTSNGLKPKSVVYVFQPSPDGAGTSFVGPFRVSEDTREANAALIPNWRMRQEDADQWNAGWRFGPNWRIRASIPRQHKQQFLEFETLMLRKDELLAAQQLLLQQQQTAKTKAEEHLALRNKELKGDPDQKNQSLEKFLIEGYHKAVADLELARNSTEAEVDALRRQIKRTRDEIDRLNQENTQLVAEEGANDVPKAATNQKSTSSN